MIYLVGRLSQQSRIIMMALAIMLVCTPFSALASSGEKGTIHYVSLGDSLAAGQIFDKTYGNGFVDFIAGDLEANGYDVSVKNHGVSGYTSGQVLTDLPEQSEDLAQADIITLSVGANDILSVVLPWINEVDLSLVEYLSKEKVAELMAKKDELEAGIQAELDKILQASNTLGDISLLQGEVLAYFNQPEMAPYQSFVADFWKRWKK